MKSAAIGGLAAAFLLVFGLTVIAWGEGTPPTPAPGATPKEAKKVDKAEKAAAPVKEQIAFAEKALQLAQEEAAKPDKTSDVKRIENLKLAAVKAYVAAAMAAKNGAGSLKPDERQGFLDQYFKPNVEKAITVLLEVAETAKANKRYLEAVNFYKQVQQIDPQNQAAADGIKAVMGAVKGGGKKGK